MVPARPTYEFEKCLGRGGYGEVYLARQQRPGGLSRRVAVKILRTGTGQEQQAVKRLRDEGRMLALLDHPAILGVIEMTRIDGRVALVTEYVEGFDVSRCCRPGSLMPARVVIGIIGEVAAALHTAWHTPSPETDQPLELIHRDIKPENIRVSKHGEVKLLDFGIARSTQIIREAQTAAGSMPFTVGYAAPEAFNEGVQVHKSDVFALGVTAYRMVVGERLYEGLDLASQLTLNSTRDRFEKFVAKRLDRTAADPGVVALLRDMLAYDLADRPTADEVAGRCEDLADGLSGPTYVRWARGQTFAEPAGIADGELVGRRIEADQLGAGLDFDRDAEVAAAREDEPTEQAPPSAMVLPPPAGSAAGHVPLDSLIPIGRDRPSAGPASRGTDSLPIPDEGLQTLPARGLDLSSIPAGFADAETKVIVRPGERAGLGFKVLLAVVTLGVFALVVLTGASVVLYLLI